MTIFAMYSLFTLFSTVTVSISALMQPICTLILAYAVLGERLVPKEFYFLIAALVGSIVIVS
jgi:drug/metabolite transporter (DMT)-like permease